MARNVTFEDFTPGERADGLPYTLARIEEAATADGARAALQVINLATGPGVAPVGLDPDPSEPQARTLTTTLAQLASGYYWVVFIDAAGHEQSVGPVYAPAQAETYTSPVAVRQVLAPDGSRDQSTAASLSDDDIEQAIDEAQAEVDSRLAQRYTVPFALPAPAVVSQVTRDIAAYLATLTFRKGKPIPDGDPVALRYTRAEDLLKAASLGTVQLVAAGPPAVVAGTAEAAVENIYEGNLFGLEDFDLVAGQRRWPWEG